MMIRVGDKTFDAIVQTRAHDSAWEGRESKAITMDASYAEAVEWFPDDTVWSVIADIEKEDGTIVQVETDMSEYAISGPVTDNRDGTVTIRMGKYLNEELMSIPLNETPRNHSEAQAWRGIIENTIQNIDDDAVALTAAPLHPAWDVLAASGADAKVGMRFRHNGKLYRVITAHTFAAHWVPGVGTESLYVRIDETHDGTESDPIPYDGNMALEEGLYYSQYGTVYLCTRSTGNPVYNALSELAGLYVEAVS